MARRKKEVAPEVVEAAPETPAEEASVEAEVEATPEEKPAKAAKMKAAVAAPIDVSELLNSLFKEVMPQMIAATIAAVKKAETDSWIERQPKKLSGERCQDCRQLKVACKGKHREVVIYPTRKNAKWSRFFPGVTINGETYLSSRPGHKVTVPADCAVEHLVQEWERNEEIQAEGRQADFNSGTISGSGSSNTFRADARHMWA